MTSNLPLSIEISNLILEALKTTPTQVHLCCWEGKLQCLESHHTSIPHKIFKTFHRETGEIGWTYKEWHTLTETVAHFLEKEKMCQNQSKS